MYSIILDDDNLTDTQKIEELVAICQHHERSIKDLLAELDKLRRTAYRFKEKILRYREASNG